MRRPRRPVREAVGSVGTRRNGVDIDVGGATPSMAVRYSQGRWDGRHVAGFKGGEERERRGCGVGVEGSRRQVDVENLDGLNKGNRGCLL